MASQVKLVFNVKRIKGGQPVSTLYNVPLFDQPQAEFTITPPQPANGNEPLPPTRYLIFDGGVNTTQGYRLLVLGQERNGEPVFSHSYAVDNFHLAEQLAGLGLSAVYIHAIGEQMGIDLPVVSGNTHTQVASVLSHAKQGSGKKDRQPAALFRPPSGIPKP